MPQKSTSLRHNCKTHPLACRLRFATTDERKQEYHCEFAEINGCFAHSNRRARRRKKYRKGCLQVNEADGSTQIWEDKKFHSFQELPWQYLQYGFLLESVEPGDSR